MLILLKYLPINYRLGMLTLREDIEKQVTALFGQTNQTSQHSGHKLTEIRE